MIDLQELKLDARRKLPKDLADLTTAIDVAMQCGENITLTAGTMHAIIDRMERAERAQVREGWKAAPVNPTEDMVIAGFESTPDRVFDGDKYPEEYEYMSGCQQAAFRAKRCYAAMIAAAPTVPQGE